MIAEVATLKLKLDPDPLPFPGLDLTFRLAIRESRLNRLNQVSKLSSYHAEQEYYSVLIHGLVAETTKINRISVGRTIPQFGVLVSRTEGRRIQMRQPTRYR